MARLREASLRYRVETRWEEMARAAEIIKQEYLSDGTVAVTLQLSLYGGFAQMLLPFDIEQIETIKAGTADNQVTSGRALPKGPASQTSDKAGDGTTTATVLAQAIVKEGMKAVAAGMNPMDLKRGIDLATTKVVEQIKAAAREVDDSAEVADALQL